MPFNSIEYLFFFPIVFLLYWAVFSRNEKMQNLLIIVASCFFYGCWNWKFLSLILITAFSCYLAGFYADKFISIDKRKSKLAMILAIVLNIGILFYYKYSNFFIQSFLDLFTLFGKNLDTQPLKIILPIGISFYTFTSLSYVMDIYLRKQVHTTNVLAYFAYVIFFPSIFCGPISRSTKQLPQFFEKRVFSNERAVEGCKLVLWGFFMKLCVADRLGIYVDAVYNNILQHNGTSISLASFLYAFQLYCDFGGYSLIAIGTGKLFGIDLLENFRRPYLANSFSEYWKRNHISLTQWLMDYIYYPMIGNSSKLAWWNFCMIVTFLLSGLWHGSAWTFIIWGLYNGIFLILSTNNSKRKKKFEKKYKLKDNWLWKIACILVTFIIVDFGLIFFRANNVGDAFDVITKIFTERGWLSGNLFIDPDTMVYGFVFVAMLFVKDFMEEFFTGKVRLFNNEHLLVRWISYIVVVCMIMLFGVLDGGSFIYFQF